MSEQMDLIAALGKVQEANLNAATRAWKLTANTVAQLWGRPAPWSDVVSPDNRFRDDAWRETPATNWLWQAYLVAARWMLDLADGWEPLDPDTHRQARFWTQQVVDATNPANFPLTNPVVLHETVRTGGANLTRGAQNLLADLRRGRISQVAEGAFQVGRDLAITPGQVVYRNRLVELIQYAPNTDRVHATPLLVVPPWINRYYVMDLRPENSLFKYLVDAGFTLFTISWRNPGSDLRHLGWEEYVELGALDALRVVRAITGAEQVNMAGYCVGGILLETVQALLAATGDASIASATYLTTHLDFSHAGDMAVFLDEPSLLFVEWLMNASGGYLDGRNLAATFNILRANDLIWEYAVNNYLMGQEPPAFDLLYWNGDGTRVPERVHAFLLRNLFLENRLMEPGKLEVKGTGLDMGRITTPVYAVAGTGDHIVPWSAAFKLRELAGGPVRFILAEGGHIGGIINPPAAKKRGYWLAEDAARDASADAWRAGATYHEGSWWNDWVTWLRERAGERVAPPSLGNEEFPPIVEAPGTYVLEQ